MSVSYFRFLMKLRTYLFFFFLLCGVSATPNSAGPFRGPALPSDIPGPEASSRTDIEEPFGLHKFYLSVTQITYRPDSDALQLILRIFTDDLEFALLDRFKVNSRLDTDQESEETAMLLENYTAELFAIEIDGTTRRLDFIGWKYELDQTWIYLELPQSGLKEARSLSIENRLLLDSQEEQKNMTHLNLNYFKDNRSVVVRKTWVFRRGYIKETLNFE